MILLALDWGLLGEKLTLVVVIVSVSLVIAMYETYAERKIAAFIQEIANTSVDTGVIDVAMHRDDVGTRRELPVVRASELPVPLEGRTVIIVDDVLYTGRTVRAAMDAINSFGRPARIQLAVLVDRGHRELPIRPDYVGKNLPTATREKIQVRLQETDKKPDGVYMEKP